MRVEKKLFVKFLLMVMAVSMVSIKSSTATLHRVGNKHGWNPNVNYSEWSDHERFYVGDWLLFNFDKRYFNVLEVNETSYNNCNDQGFIKNITRGGRDVVELTEARPYYFLSSGGYCYNGMKVAVDVVAQAAPAPAPVKNGSPPSISVRILLFLISFAVAYFLLVCPFV
ncbi:early nodulin-like protein 20 [Hibiscus trionum]|uniref:Early nodulin-like protein 20 n=1 Tax=Hibiscus trionum TaxID=183268 RepID=A0A9W7GZ04_HIBTR|nr:early nodulin-like protein 20 [Hibiscus trionum]